MSVLGSYEETLSNRLRVPAVDRGQKQKAILQEAEGDISFDLLPFQWRPLSNQIMAGRRILSSDVRCMAIRADECFVLVDRGEFFIEVFARSNFVVAFSA